VDVGQQPPQVVHSPVASFADQLQGVVTARIGRDQLLLVVPVQPAVPVHAVLLAGGARPGLVRNRADLGRIVDVTDELSRVPWHAERPRYSIKRYRAPRRSPWRSTRPRATRSAMTVFHWPSVSPVAATMSDLGCQPREDLRKSRMASAE